MASNKKSKLARQQAATKARRESKQGAATVGTTKSAPATKAEKKKQTQSLGIKVAAVIFAFILAGSMMLPSCSAIFEGRNARNAQQQAAEAQALAETEAAEAEAAETTEAEATEELTGIELADSSYQPLVDELKAKLDENPDDLASILNLGNYYMSWGIEVGQAATTDQENLYASDLFDEAVSYFDRYLELNESNDVRSRRALCRFYAGDTQDAIRDLEEFTEGVTDYGPAWVYLGMMYESTGHAEDAEQAYLKAEAADPDDLYGSKSYAEERIAAMHGTDASASGTTGATSGTSLQDVLSGASGTGY